LTDHPTLFHWTAPTTSHLGAILHDRAIWPSESNLRPDGSGPPVVWLTTNSEPGHQWSDGSPLKNAARMSIKVGDAKPWSQWAIEHGINPTWSDALGRAGGDPDAWWVLERPVRPWDITALEIYAPPAGDDWTDDTPVRRFEGVGLRKLFESAAARRALGLLDTGSQSGRRSGRRTLMRSR
jgi:hypothetical protein